MKEKKEEEEKTNTGKCDNNCGDRKMARRRRTWMQVTHFRDGGMSHHVTRLTNSKGTFSFQDPS